MCVLKLKKKKWVFLAIFTVLLFISIIPQNTRIEREKGRTNPKEAYFYQKLDRNRVQCDLCPRKCIIPSGSWGFCRARKNIDGILYSMGYASPCAVHVDPIEKKPFNHFHPGTKALSIASAGCNMRCKFCQNWEISQKNPTETSNYNLKPEMVVNIAISKNTKSIAYTYSEPINFYEYMIDTSRIAKRSGIRNVVHTNGFINKEPLEKLCKFVDAFCVDLKGFTEEFYKKNTSANLEQVLESLQIIKGNGVWLELVNLVIPSQNDSLEKIKEMSLWIKKNLGKNVPLTFSRFYPTHKLTNLPPTPVSTLEKAREIAVKAGLNYVYIGNVPGHKYEDTYCPNCGDKIIDRYGYHIVSNKIIEGRCKFCGYEIKGVWNEK